MRLDPMQPRQTADRRQRPQRVQWTIPSRHACEPREGKGRELQPRLQPPREPVQRCRLDVVAELGPIGLQQPMRMTLIPPKAPPHEKPLLAHRHIVTGHHVAWHAADIAPVAQDHPGLAEADGAERQEGCRRGEAQQWAQCERPGCDEAESCGADADNDGVELHGRPKQHFHRMPLRHVTARCRSR